MMFVDATVAVALITSLSTLTAAGLAGAVSLRVASKQLRHQETIAREDRAEQRAAAHRDMRREAYERFLSQVDTAYRLLDDGWKAPIPAESRWWEDAFAIRRTVAEAYFRVELVGPQAVKDRANEVLESVFDEFRSHRRVTRSLGEATTAAEADSSAHRNAIRARQTTTERFVVAARAGFGNGVEEGLPAIP
ncbi:hypothetical protein AN218_17820 [Streptomyces nanshensis]|uniref:Uncharacterized protein n=1 Tax=Streptomyces nanshensis TaxID=518642 RepID=A0A1E7L2H8_9ACTN|nr:hypothetical protein AN218_17820 [Streptomyces nanshensis]